jgi:hypothetical protein
LSGKNIMAVACERAAVFSFAVQASELEAAGRTRESGLDLPIEF